MKDGCKLKRISLLQLIIAPGKTFKNASECPNFLVPTLIIFVSALQVFFVARGPISFVPVDHLSPKQYQLGYRIMMTMLLFVGSLFLWFVKYKFLYYGAKLLKGETNSRLLKSRVGYCYLPEAIKSILLVPAALMMDTSPPIYLFSLASFMEEDITSKTFLLLQQVDIFKIWSLVLLIFAITFTCNISRIKAVYLGLAYFILVAVMRIFL